MGNYIISGKLDSLFLRESDSRIFIVLGFYDDLMEMPQHVTVDVTEELEQIYKGFEFDRAFVKRLEKKLKLTLGDKGIYVKYSIPFSWTLCSPLNEIYSPLIFMPNMLQHNKPLKLKATVVNFRRTEEGEGFPLVGIIAECIIGDLKIPCFSEFEEQKIGIYFDSECADEVKLDIAYVDVDANFEFIYSQLVDCKCDRKDFVNKKNRLMGKHDVYSIIANKLLGKVIELEYDEYYGYTIPESLIYTIDEYYY